MIKDKKQLVLRYKPHDAQKIIHEDNHRFKVVCAGRRFGKALDINTPIPVPTEKLYKPMGDIQLGDKVFDENGNICNVTFVTEHQLNRKCYLVKFDDGSEIIADEDHLWQVQSHEYRKSIKRVLNKSNITIPEFEVKTTKELLETLTYDLKGSKRWHIPVHQPICFEEKELQIDPYLLGLWLGDGNSLSNQITCDKKDYNFYKQELIKRAINVTKLRKDRSTNCGNFSFGVINYTNKYKIVDRQQKLWHVKNGIKTTPYLYSNTYKSYSCRNIGRTKADGPKFKISYKTILQDNNLIKNKHIPLIYLQSSIEQRIDLVRGLMDTDGTFCNNGVIEFYNTNKLIADAFCYLLGTLGVIYHRSIKKTWIKVNNVKKECLDCHRIRLKTPWFNPFLIERKKEKFEAYKKIRRRTNTRIIKNITDVPSRPVKCIQVDSPNNLYLCGQEFITTHNTICCASDLVNRILNKSYNYNQFTDLGWIAPTLGMATRGLDALKLITRDCPQIVKITNSSPITATFINGVKIRYLSSDNPDSLRGYGWNHVICDEADYTADYVYYDIIRPALMDKQGSMIAISSPRRKNTWFHKMYLQGLEDNELIKSFHFPSSSNPKNTKEELEATRLTQPHNVYVKEYLAEWMDSGGEVFQGIDKCINTGTCTCNVLDIIGVDLAKHQDYTVILKLCSRCKRIKSITRINALDWPTQKNMIKSVYINSVNPIIIVDSTGVGDVIYDDLRHEGINIRPFKFTNASKQEIINGLRLRLMNSEINWSNELENAQILRHELECYEIQETRTGMVTYNGAQGTHDDVVIALALACHGLKSFIHPNIAADETVESFDTMSNIGWSDNEDNKFDFGGNAVFFG